MSSPKSYACVLFDLDHTLWDYETNSEDALRDLFTLYKLSEKGISSFSYFMETFRRVNRGLWEQYDRGHIGQDVIRQERFHRVFTQAGYEDYKASLQFSTDYLALLPLKSGLLPHAKDILQYLHGRYPMIVVTNGFEETQSAKMNSAGISHFFDHLVTSQRAGSKKPSRDIFDFSLNKAGFQPEEAVMIGDNLLTDIAGAKAAGVDTVYYNPEGLTHNETITFEIRSLKELKTIL